MIEYTNIKIENEESFNKYIQICKNLQKEKKHYENLSEELPIFYFKCKDNFLYDSNKLSQPYYDEISVDLIFACNVTGSRKEIITKENYARVKNSFSYILDDKCSPINVIKTNKGYYIENGKHRFYAHILLNKCTIPVSVREIVNEIENEVDMVKISMPFLDQSFPTADPKKVLDFVENYVELFKNVRNIKMSEKTSNSSQKLKIKLEDNSVIEFNGCCTSGNNFKSSEATCEIIKKCGYQIDMEYIKNNSSFELSNIRDAHNMDFSKETNIAIINNIIRPNFNNKKNFNNTQVSERDYLKLLDYIVKDEMFNVSGGCSSPYNSCYLEVNNEIYFFTGVINRDSNELVAIFRYKSFPFISTDLEYIGILDKTNEQFHILEFKE